jgi:hypothetical protein
MPLWALVLGGLITLLAVLALAVIAGGSIVWRSSAGRGWRW